MIRRYDMLVIDLDGTLLRSDGTVSARNARAIARARESGLEIVIATGRSFAESREAISALEHRGVVIAAGGSILCDASTGRTIHRRAMSAQIVCEVTRWLLEHDLAALILKDSHAAGYDYLIVGEAELHPASQWWFTRMASLKRHVAAIDHDEHPQHTIRAGAVAQESKLRPLARWLQAEFDGLCAMQHWSAVTSTHAVGSHTHLLEVFDTHVCKWSMLVEHCHSRGVPSSRIAAIGDGLNDIELVANAGLGVSMANASPEVKRVASRATAHHDQDGVALAIDRILSGEW